MLTEKASDPQVVKAAQAFVQDAGLYVQQRRALTGIERETLTSFYQQQFAAQFQTRNGKAFTNVQALVTPLNQRAMLLQHDFIRHSALKIVFKGA